MSQVHGVVAVSNNTLRGLHALYGLEDQQVAQIPRGIDPERLAPALTRQHLRQLLGVGPDDPVVVFVGSLTREKRPDRLARVFKQVARELPDARLWIVGEGPERNTLEAQLSSLGGRVHLAGESDDVGSFVGGADVLLLTSDTEGLPGAVLEAAALGLPAVATNVGGVADAVRSGVTGVLVDRQDEEALASAVLALLTNSRERTRLGSAAQQQFVNGFSIGTITGRYESFYRQVLSSPETPED
jgi:glycosyltransferase involved in cell wall biosynthesis